MKKDELLVKARKALEPLWQHAKKIGLVGRCWGNGFNGSTIVMANANQLAVIYLEGGELCMKEFVLIEKIGLGDVFEDELKKAGLKINRGK